MGFYNKPSGYNNQPKRDAQTDRQAMLTALEEENRKAIQSRRPAASATNYKGPGVISSIHHN